MAVHQRFNVGLDTGQFDRGAQRLIDVSGRTAREVAANWNRVNRGEGIARALNGGRGGNGSGGVAVQIQDIAVQLQSGTKLATIIAQQGSQLASVFGPQGAIIGGMIAVIAFLHTISRGTTKLIDDGNALGKAIDKSAYSFSGLSDNIEKAQANLKALKDEAATKSGKTGMFSQIGDALVGGYGVLTGQGTKKEKAEALARAQKMRQLDIMRGQELAIQLSERELALAEAEATGDQKKIGALRDKQAYEEKIAEIKNSAFDKETKDRLIELAADKEDQQNANRIRQEREKESKDRVEAQKEINAETEKQKDIQKDINDLGKSDLDRLKDLQIIQSSALNSRSTDPLTQAKARVIVAQTELDKRRLIEKIQEFRAKASMQNEKDHSDELDRQLEKEKKIGDLRIEALDEAARKRREIDYQVGQETIDNAARSQLSGAERAQIKRDDKARQRAIRREAEKQADREDLDLRKNGRGLTGLSAKERKARIAEIIRKAEEAKKRDKIEAKFAPDQIREIVKQIAELQAK